jgi:hypothetical protein
MVLGVRRAISAVSMNRCDIADKPDNPLVQQYLWNGIEDIVNTRMVVCTISH